MLTRIEARMLLSECTGRDIWPVELCRQKGIPEAWIEQRADCFESGHLRQEDAIFFGERPVNQFHGVQDLHLARQLGGFLGIDTAAVTAHVVGRVSEVRAIQEAVDEI